MKVIEFIEKFTNNKVFNSKINENAVSDYIKTELEVQEYIPFIEKQSIAQIVLESCSNIKDGVISIDSVQKYTIYTITMLSTYTNLEFNGDETDLDDYDALCSYRVGNGTLLDTIIGTFEKEYVRCNEILNMMTADLLAENNIEKQVGKLLSNISTKIDNFSGILANKIENFDADLSQLDIDKLTNAISKIK